MKLKTFDERLRLTNGVEEALIATRKPKDIENKKAYLVGTGIASLAAAFFLIEDAHMDGSKITFLEELDIAGGSLDGAIRYNAGYVARGGREIPAHYQVLWQVFSKIPSTEDPSMSVLEYFFYLNFDDPNFSKCRITEKQGQRYDNLKFNLNKKLVKELMKFIMIPDDQLQNKRINEMLSVELLESDFWILWRSMFAFENWHSALEMKLYMNRFVHLINGLPDMSTLNFSRHDQYTSFVLPLVKYLKDKGAVFKYNTSVENVLFDISEDKKIATKIIAHDKDNKDCSIDLTEDDLVFITLGSMTESSGYGNDDTPAPFINELGNSWNLWKNISAQSSDFGHPEKFCSNTDQSNWESCTITCHNSPVVEYIEKITKRSPYTGKTVTGGIVTVKDSPWYMSWTINRQGQYIDQPKDDVVVWMYGLFSNMPGSYIKKPMIDCTGKEMIQEWLYQIGVPTNEIEELAKTCTAVPVMMPFITAQFMPREFGDRPYAVPKNAVNFGFLGQFTETLDNPGRDTVFTIEYSGRTAMEAVFILTGVEKGVPEVFNSRYDIRYLLNSIHVLMDGKEYDSHIPPMLEKLIEKTDIGLMLDEYGII